MPIRIFSKYRLPFGFFPFLTGLFLACTGIFILLNIISDVDEMLQFFSIVFFGIGALEITYALQIEKGNPNKKWNIAIGIFTASIGLLILTEKSHYAEILSFYIGILLIFRSTISFNLALDVQSRMPNKGFIALIGSAILFVLGCLLVWKPDFFFQSQIYWIGISLLCSGIINIYIHDAFKKLHAKHLVEFNNQVANI
jgi:uncharacterized membrane protein HdeD (DUF308 family)